MKTIVVWNHKGGVGKTTLAVHLAAGFASRKHRVLLVDADRQANALKWVSGYEAEEEEGAEWVRGSLTVVWSPRAAAAEVASRAREMRAQYAIVDTPPTFEAPARFGADLWLMPVVGRLSMDGADWARKALSGKRIALVPMMGKPGMKWYEDDLEAAQSVGMKMLPAVPLSTTVRRAEQVGRLAWEMPYARGSEAVEALGGMAAAVVGAL